MTHTQRAQPRRPSLAPALFTLAALSFATSARAGFSGTDVVVPAVARAQGAGGSNFFSTVWVTNLGSLTATVEIQLLLQGQANPSPAARTVTVAPGATRRIDNIVGDLFSINNRGAALRLVSDREVFVSSRTYDQPPGTALKDSKGTFFNGIPASFAIASGETASLQGVTNGPDENFRYNFGLVETTGRDATVRVTLRDESGNALQVRDYELGPYQALQVNAFAGFSPVSLTNGRLDAAVLSGSGRALFFGSQVAGTNAVAGSNDASGIEMSFKSSLLGGAAGVMTLNGLSGNVVLAAGSGLSVTPSGNTLTIASTQTGGLTLPYAGSGSVTSGGSLLRVSAIGDGSAIAAEGSTGPALAASTSLGVAIVGTTLGNTAGIDGQSVATTGFSIGVRGESRSTNGIGVQGRSSAPDGPAVGVAGDTISQSGRGIQGTATNGGVGVYGLSSSLNTSNYGVHGVTRGNEMSAGVFGESTSSTSMGFGVRGRTASSSNFAAGVIGEFPSTFGAGYGVRGETASSHASTAGVFGAATRSTGSGGLFFNQSDNISVSLASKGLGITTNGEVSCSKLTATVKAFIQPHPTDAGREIEYLAVEAPRAEIYFRGSARLVGGHASIPIPEHFRLVAREGSYMTTVTPVGAPGSLYIEQEGSAGVVVRGKDDVAFHYVVYAERELFKDHEPIKVNTHFTPESMDRLQSVKTMDDAIKALLIENGVLNADGTYNEATARRLGWVLPEARRQGD